MKKLYQFIIAAALTILALAGQAQAQIQNLQYWSQDVIATNSVFQPGTTNLTSANYLPGGRFVDIHGINLNNGYAQNILLEFVSGQYLGTNTWAAQYPTNVLATLVPVFDDYSIAFKDPLPPTNYAVTVSFTVPALANGLFYGTNSGTVYSYPYLTNCGTYFAQINATNFLGAKYFICTALTYNGTNALAVKHFRAGGWTGPF